MARATIPHAVQAQIFQRDKWCCRYCGIEVFFSPALEAMERLAPDHGYWQRNGRSDKMSKVLLARCACVDHVRPVVQGGDNGTDNLVCACWSCNSTKSGKNPTQWKANMIPIEHLETADGWDGFVGLLNRLDPENKWLKYFNASDT